MNISITPELEQLDHEKVSSGLYPSADAVICDALSLLQFQDQSKQEMIDSLRKEIQIGIDSGPAEELDMEKIISNAKARWSI